MKMAKARRVYTCNVCKGRIAKGEPYVRKNVRLGSSKADTIENIGGVPSIMSHGITVAVKHCENCADV
jgi:hypothetical protein